MFKTLMVHKSPSRRLLWSATSRPSFRAFRGRNLSTARPATTPKRPPMPCRAISSPRSPLYELQIDGKTPLASVLTVPIPNDSEPYATLDLYEWTGSTWQFVPGHVIREDDTVLSELNRVPASFMVMQTNSVPPTAAAVVPEGQTLPDAGRDALTEVTPFGLSLQGDGSIQGNITAGSNAGGSYGVVPVLRNWGDDGVVRTDLFENLMVSEELQQAHIEAIVNTVVGNNYPGIEIDYRGLDPTLSEAYTAFIGKVADALHAKNKTLAVRVEAPTQIAEDRWSTGGYSWRDLSQAVDTFRIPALIDPAAYAPGGQMESMLTWAVGEAPRHKIDLVLPARSVEKAGQYLILQGYDEALTPLLGESRTETPVLVPGEPVDISMINDRVIGGLSFDDNDRHVHLQLPGRCGLHAHGLDRERRQHSEEAGAHQHL